MRRLTRLVLALAVLAGAGSGGLLYWAHSQPKPDLLPAEMHWSRAVVDRDGHLMHLSLSDDGFYRLPVKQGSISREMMDATVRYEDRYFYTHPGINPFSVVQAAWATWTGPRRIGASTITMQLARLVQKLDTRTWEGKLNQMLWALRYEAHYGKDEILNAYLTLAPYGGNVEGIEAAAHVYFGKHASQLTSAESVALSVVPQNPVKRRPGTGEDFEKARLAVGGRAIDEGFINARLAPAILGPLKTLGTADLPFAVPHLTRYVEEHTKSPFIKTTVSLSLNDAMQKLVSDTVARLRPYGVENGALLVVDSRDMSVLAHVGSADFSDASIAGEVDGTLARRSPGSTLKPFIYGLALDQGLIHSKSVLLDAPKNFRGYQPKNADKKFRGPLNATEALNDSRNVPAVTLAGALKPDLYAFLTEGGVRFKHPREHYGLSIVLGGAEVTMTNIAELYGTLANQGLWRPLARTTADLEADRQAKPLLTPESAWIVRRMLLEGGEKMHVDGVDVPVLWKTGTSNGYRDAWTAGYAGHYLIVAWLGNFNGRADAHLQGALAAQPLFRSAAARILTDRQFAMTDKAVSRLEAKPQKVTAMAVCRNTGDLQLDAREEVRCANPDNAWFIPGVSPIRDTGFLKPVLIDTATGLRACKEGDGVERVWLEAWPSDYQEQFLNAGILKAPLPEWTPACRSEDSLSNISGKPPTILSPRDGVRYVTGTFGRNKAGVLLKASLAPDAKLIYWFADDQFLGAGKPRKPILWQPTAGTYRVVAVDDLGRRSERTVVVKQP